MSNIDNQEISEVNSKKLDTIPKSQQIDESQSRNSPNTDNYLNYMDKNNQETNILLNNIRAKFNETFNTIASKIVFCVAVLSTILSITFGILFAINYNTVTNINNMCEKQITKLSINKRASLNVIVTKAYEMGLTATKNICQFTYPNSSNSNNN